jgi:hypothetical protein
MEINQHFVRFRKIDSAGSLVGGQTGALFPVWRAK